MRAIAKALAAGALGLAAAGCSTTELEEQVRDRDQEIAVLQQENQDLRNRIASKEGSLQDLRTRLAEKPKEVIVERTVTVPAKPATALTEAGFKVDERADGTAVVLESGILFDSGQATLTPAGKEAIAKLVKVLKKDYANRKIRVEGHTDNQPIRIMTTRGYKSNWDLSYGRSKSVFDELNGAGVAKMSIGCYADTRPRADNKSEPGRKENRRVEVLLEK
ncbi:MAG: chemotaxis protein [Planctomycetota bacterium]|nr:MAG: chemotaxis protein [Planctomycetota bacterium]